MAIHFSEEDVRPMGRAAYGVKGIELEEGDEVVALEVVDAAGTVLTVTENGYGKRTDHRRVPAPEPRRQGHHQHQDRGPQRRGGRGQVPARRRRGDAHHRKGYDHPPEHSGHLDHRPQHPGRAPDPARGGRPPGVGGPPRRAGGRRRERSHRGPMARPSARRRHERACERALGGLVAALAGRGLRRIPSRRSSTSTSTP